MNAAETIAAAIKKLEAFKAHSTPGDWEILDGGDRFIAWHQDPATGFEYIVGEPIEFENGTDADLIVSLHRTIDAQLAILRTVYDARLVEHNWGSLVYTENAYVLARAILVES